MQQQKVSEAKIDSEEIKKSTLLAAAGHFSYILLGKICEARDSNAAISTLHLLQHQQICLITESTMNVLNLQ